MTSVQQLARIRTLLDEATASMWTDAESYSALADAQNEIINILLSVYKAKLKADKNAPLPYELESVLNDDTATATPMTVPTSFVALISATYDHNGSGGEKPCYIVDLPMIGFTEDNTYLIADEFSPSVYLKTATDTLKIYFLPASSGTPAMTVHFIKTPTDIASGQNPTLPATTHNAMIFWATAFLLFKDGRPNEANNMMQLFNQEIQKIV